ncbi:MAG TPA: hypothetical protein VGK95_11560 [Caldimonas sp.]|jgi:hypothetical protein
MIGVVATIAVRVAACSLLSWAVWRWFGLAPMVGTVPLFGIALAKPLIDLASEVHRAMNHAHWRDVQGEHYAFHGRPVRVLEDVEHVRWVRLADVRAIVGFTATDGALAVAYPDGVRRLGRPAEAYLRDEALLAHLAKERSPEALRLSTWVDREIVFPARRERERLGIRRPAAADLPD